MKRTTLDAVYQHGALWPTEPLPLPENARVRIAIEADDLELGEAVGRQSRPFSRVSRWWRAMAGVSVAVGTVELVLFSGGFLIYAFTHFWALDQFPVYFFGDEASIGVYADDLIASGFRRGNTWLPLYFEAAAARWTPLFAIYLHVLPLLAFGKSIVVARATSAVISLLAVAAVSIILKEVLRLRGWWIAPLVLAVIPAWLLHSRTAFETATMASFYACFLCFYLLYRVRSRWFLFPAILFGAATFYTYSNGQMVMAASGVLLLFSDLLYHLKNGWRLVPAAAMTIVVALPAILFQLGHQTAARDHLRMIQSYWFSSKEVGEKLLTFVQTYAFGLSPHYWFLPNNTDLERHLMNGFGHVLLPLLPFALIGAGICVWRIRSPAHRAIVLAMLAAPVGAALAQIGITRVMALIIPIALFIALGLDLVLTRLSRRAPYELIALATFAVFSGASVFLLRSALTDGPLWMTQYGLYGMQYGAKQLFEEAIPEYLARDSTTRVLVSANWANNTDMFARFLLRPDQKARVQMGTVDQYLFEKLDLRNEFLFVMTPDEHERAVRSGKFAVVDVDKILPYPSGAPGFYFGRLAYAGGVENIFAAERAARLVPVDDVVALRGQQVAVRHSRLDMGAARQMFDGDAFSLARGIEANPFFVELSFPDPQTITGLGADFATMDFRLTVEMQAERSDDVETYEQTFRGLPDDPHVEMTFDRGPERVRRMRIEVLNLQAGQTAKIHVRDLALRP